MIYATGYIIYIPESARYFSEYWWRPVVVGAAMTRPDFPRFYGTRKKAEQVAKSTGRLGWEVREVTISDN